MMKQTDIEEIMTLEEEMEHEDAFQAANLHAGKIVDMGNRPINEVSLKGMQKEYKELFSAFIAGVAWARKNPK